MVADPTTPPTAGHMRPTWAPPAAPAAFADCRVPDAGQGVDARVIRSYEAFVALGPEWNRLASLCTSVFLRHEWFDAVWRSLPERTAPLIVVLEREGHPFCICPLAVTRGQPPYSLRRHVTFLSVPDTQEADVLVAPEDEHLGLDGLTRWLIHNAGAWDSLELRDIPPAHGRRDTILASMARCGLQGAEIPDNVNYAVDVCGDWDAYYGSISRKVRKSVNLAANRLRRAGEPSLVREDGSGDDVDRVLADAIAVSGRSWKRGLDITLDTERPGQFIHRLTEHARENGWLSLWILYLDNAPIAMEYQLRYAGRVHALRADFDEAFDALSPGLHVHVRQLETDFADPAVAEYLMGPGANPYKLRWVTDLLALQGLRAWAPSLRGRLYQVWDRGMRPRLAAAANLFRAALARLRAAAHRRASRDTQ